MKTSKILVILTILIGILSCNPDDDSSSNENPNAFTGIYSGVLIGSTGAYELNLTENGATASVLFDGTNYTLSSNEILENGQSITLTDGTISLTFTVGISGENLTITFDIPNHVILATIQETTASNNSNLYVGTIVDKESTDGGVTFTDIFNSTYNISLTNDNFSSLDKIIDCNCTDDGVIFREEGTIVNQTNSQITLRTLKDNDGGNTPLVDLDTLDQQESEITFEKSGNQLTSIYEETSGNTIYREERILIKVEF